MFKQAELILTPLCLLISTILLVVIIFRIRNVYCKKNARVPIWKKEVGIIYKISKLLLSLSLILMITGLIYFIFIAVLPSSVIRIYAKTLFIIIVILWTLIEVFYCMSIYIKLNESVLKRIMFFLAVVISIAGSVYLFPIIIKSLPYPAESDCVILELPVKGIWIAGHAGATDITNNHSTNRYAADFLKLGPDGRFYKDQEDTVTGYYSYNEPIYAVADGYVTKMVDSLQSDLMGKSDKNNPGGNIVIMDIGNEKYVYFAHLIKGSIEVCEGQFVKTGTLLGRVGNSGNSFIPHLHIQVQNKPNVERDGRITYPFRFSKMKRKRLIFWKEVSKDYLLRNDRFSNLLSQHSEFPKLTRPYLGQTPPGMTPEIFAPGIVSTEQHKEFSGTFTPDGKEYYFFRFADDAGMMVSKLLDDGWTAPKPSRFNTEHIDNEPHITPNGKYFFLNSNRPVPGHETERMPTQIWFMERMGDSWDAPKHLCEGMFVTSPRNGNIYLNDGITKLVNGKFIPFQKVVGALNTPPSGWKQGHHSSIALDESYLIYDTQRSGSEWNADENLFVCFRMEDGTWSEAYDLGSKLNLPGGKMLATISQDNKYLFFCNRGDIYWVDAKIIEELRPKELLKKE